VRHDDHYFTPRFGKTSTTNHMMAMKNDIGVLNSQQQARVRIQKPVVTYDSGKSSVTSCAGLPNYFLKNYHTFFEIFITTKY
jgi:hypothetical protein